MTLIVIAFFILASGLNNISEADNPLYEGVFLKVFGISQILISVIAFLTGFIVFLRNI